MGVSSGEQEGHAPWIYIYGIDIVDGGLIVLFLVFFAIFRAFFR